MTKTSALKVGSKLEWGDYDGDGLNVIVTVRGITRGRIIVEWKDKRSQLHIDAWSRIFLNRALNIRVLSV